MMTTTNIILMIAKIYQTVIIKFIVIEIKFINKFTYHQPRGMLSEILINSVIFYLLGNYTTIPSTVRRVIFLVINTSDGSKFLRIEILVSNSLGFYHRLISIFPKI